jgi:hypothetical protein
MTCRKRSFGDADHLSGFVSARRPQSNRWPALRSLFSLGQGRERERRDRTSGCRRWGWLRVLRFVHRNVAKTLQRSGRRRWPVATTWYAAVSYSAVSRPGRRAVGRVQTSTRDNARHYRAPSLANAAGAAAAPCAGWRGLRLLVSPSDIEMRMILTSAPVSYHEPPFSDPPKARSRSYPATM